MHDANEIAHMTPEQRLMAIRENFIEMWWERYKDKFVPSEQVKGVVSVAIKQDYLSGTIRLDDSDQTDDNQNQTEP